MNICMLYICVCRSGYRRAIPVAYVLYTCVCAEVDTEEPLQFMHVFMYGYICLYIHTYIHTSKHTYATVKPLEHACFPGLKAFRIKPCKK